eukprot:5148840-Pleurochrysis_carterae.AAC.1
MVKYYDVWNGPSTFRQPSRSRLNDSRAPPPKKNTDLIFANTSALQTERTRGAGLVKHKRDCDLRLAVARLELGVYQLGLDDAEEVAPRVCSAGGRRQQRRVDHERVYHALQPLDDAARADDHAHAQQPSHARRADRLACTPHTEGGLSRTNCMTGRVRRMRWQSLSGETLAGSRRTSAFLDSN